MSVHITIVSPNTYICFADLIKRLQKTTHFENTYVQAYEKQTQMKSKKNIARYDSAVSFK